MSQRRRMQWKEDGEEGQDLSAFAAPSALGGPPQQSSVPAPSELGSEGGEKQNRAASKPNQGQIEQTTNVKNAYSCFVKSALVDRVFYHIVLVGALFHR